jgi:phosphoribosylformylglycinamidine cyclo-ligase
MAHVTGGGFYENLPRMMPDGLATAIELGSWPVLPIFEFLKLQGDLQQRDLYNVFNMGLGFVLAVPAAEAAHIIAIAEAHGEKAYTIGQVVKGEGVIFNGQHDGSLI